MSAVESADGIKIRPFWRIVSPGEKVAPGETVLELIPGAGWGTGSHETTQLCLQAIGVMAPKNVQWRMLDFGSGSGLLAIGAAKLGANIDAIEIDEEAIINGEENARANGVAQRVRFDRTLERVSGRFDFVVANILRPVLLTFAEDLTSRLAENGTLILSGLVATDVPEVSNRYASFLGGKQPVIYQRGEWRALIWQMQ